MSTQLPGDVSLDGLNTTRGQEGRALRAYQDTVGVWTVGYGLTNYDKGLPWRVQAGLVITEDQAEWYLLKSLRENYLPDVLRALAGGTYQHPQGAVDGGCDFHYNTGGVRKATWPRLLGSGQLAAAKASIESWNRAGGRVLSDLVNRRALNWLEVSAGQYGRITGPVNVLPNASGHETYHGTGDVLTAFPTDPNDKSPRTVTTAVPPTTPNPGVLKEGSTGTDVTAAQIKLNNAGVSTPVTGTFTADTTAAVKKFQDSHPNLGSDGEIGPATDAALDRAKNMRAAATAVAKGAAPAVPGAYIGFHQFVSDHAGNIALAFGVAATVAVVAYLAYKYRHDLVALINKWLGRVTP